MLLTKQRSNGQRSSSGGHQIPSKCGHQGPSNSGHQGLRRYAYQRSRSRGHRVPRNGGHHGPNQYGRRQGYYRSSRQGHHRSNGQGHSSELIQRSISCGQLMLFSKLFAIKCSDDVSKASRTSGRYLQQASRSPWSTVAAPASAHKEAAVEGSSCSGADEGSSFCSQFGN